MPSRRHTFPLIACIALAAPALGAENSFDGTYTGERVLTGGDAAACVAKDAVSATILGDQLTFKNNVAKGYAISFSPRPDGSFGELSANISGDAVVIRGHVGAGVLDSDVSSAHCTYHWHLEKQH